MVLVPMVMTEATTRFGCLSFFLGDSTFIFGEGILLTLAPSLHGRELEAITTVGATMVEEIVYVCHLVDILAAHRLPILVLITIILDIPLVQILIVMVGFLLRALAYDCVVKLWLAC